MKNTEEELDSTLLLKESCLQNGKNMMSEKKSEFQSGYQISLGLVQHHDRYDDANVQAGDGSDITPGTFAFDTEEVTLK